MIFKFLSFYQIIKDKLKTHELKNVKTKKFMPIFSAEDAYLCVQRCLTSREKIGIIFSKKIIDIFSGITDYSRLRINRKIFTFV